MWEGMLVLRDECEVSFGGFHIFSTKNFEKSLHERFFMPLQ
jgi:hypothetical protein